MLGIIAAIMVGRRLSASGRARAELRKQQAIRAEQARRGTLARTTIADPRFSSADHERAAQAGANLMRRLHKPEG
jgi:hypothetical protein